MTSDRNQLVKCDCKSYNGGFGTVPIVIVKAPEIHRCDTICLDACIADTIQQLWAHDIVTISSCCGHGEMPPSVVVCNDTDMAHVDATLKLIDPSRTWQVSQWQRVVYTAQTVTNDEVRYRRLEEGELIQEGDEIDSCVNAWHDDAVWKPVTNGIGTPAPNHNYVAHRQYRRPISAATAPKNCYSLEQANKNFDKYHQMWLSRRNMCDEMSVVLEETRTSMLDSGYSLDSTSIKKIDQAIAAHRAQEGK